MKITMKPLLYRSMFFFALVPFTISPFAFANEKTAAAAPVVVQPLNLFFGLVFLAAIVIAGWWLVQRAGGLQIKSGNGLRIVTAMSVGPRERVVLIEIAGEQMLLGVGPGRVNLLHRFEQPVIAASNDDFASKIRHVMQQGLNK